MEKIMPTYIKEMPSKEELQELYYYKDGHLYHKHKNISRGRTSVKGGKRVNSTPDNSGYLRLVLNKKTYPVARVIWQLVYGDLTVDDTIDHRDRNRTNNTLDNLRKADVFIQQRNKGTPINNSSGFVGVALNIKKYKVKGVEKEIHYYVARWYDEVGKLRGKHFRIDKYGNEQAFNLASDYRNSQVKLLGYSQDVPIQQRTH